MDEYLLSLVGSRVTKFVTKTQAGDRILLELHLFKEGKRTVLTVEEYSDHPTCRWIDQKLLILGQFASLMKEVVKTEVVELELIATEAVHGNFLPSGNDKWMAFTNIVLKWKDYKVYLGDLETEEVLTTGLWPSHVPLEERSNTHLGWL